MARSLPGSRESSSPSPYWYWLGLDDRKEPEGASFVYADWPDSFPFLWPLMDIRKFSSFRAGKDWISEAREPGSPSLPETGAYSPWHESELLTYDMRVTDSQENESSFLLLLISLYLFLTSYLSFSPAALPFMNNPWGSPFSEVRKKMGKRFSSNCIDQLDESEISKEAGKQNGV